jgi:sugar O-acyltransferase (sialic acid O-acetyltransferase NeuD family)
MLIIGAGGQAKDLLFVLTELGMEDRIHFYDDVSDPAKLDLAGRFPIIRSKQEASDYFQYKDNRFALGIGNPVLRKQMSVRFTAWGGRLSTVISPLAAVGTFNTEVGNGCIVLPFSMISNAARVGTGCLIHHYARVGHDSVMGDYCELSPGAILLGKSQVGDLTHIGAGAIILPSVKIGAHCMIGAGSVITKDVPDGKIVMGVPGRIIGDQVQ